MRVYEPPTAADLADWLVANAGDGGSVMVSGTTPDRRRSGLETLPDLAISTSSMASVIDLRPADLTVEVGAGMRVEELFRVAWDAGLWLPFLHSTDDRSVGGLVAEAPTSPFDESFGPVRRHFLACRLVLHDGRSTRWGRAVMKNVAGYDIPRLVCGSRGQLGIVTSATLRVWPRPRALRRIVLRGSTDGRAALFDSAPRLEGLTARIEVGGGLLEIEAFLVGGETSVERRAEGIRRWARDEGLHVDDDEPVPVDGADPRIRKRIRTRDRAVYRVTFGRRYLSPGVEDLLRRFDRFGERCVVESYPTTGVARALASGLEPAGRRDAPGWVTALAGQSTGAGTMGQDSGPSVRVERGGPAEHEACRRLRPAATRHLEGRLIDAFRGRRPSWQADYL